jgi:hypothetical protein
MGSAGVRACEIALMSRDIGGSAKIIRKLWMFFVEGVMKSTKTNQIEYRGYAFNFNPQASGRCIQIS